MRTLTFCAFGLSLWALNGCASVHRSQPIEAHRAPPEPALAEKLPAVPAPVFQAKLQTIPKFVPIHEPQPARAPARAVAFAGFAIGNTPEQFSATCRHAGAKFYEVPGYVFCSSPVRRLPVPAHVAARVKDGEVYAISIVFHEPVPHKLDQLRTATIEHFTEAYGAPAMGDDEDPQIARRCAAGEEVESVHGWVLDAATKSEMSAIFLCPKVDGESVPQFAITYEQGGTSRSPLVLPSTLASY